MPFNFRLNLNSVFRRLGIQSGARLPQLDDNVQMTMLVTDLSRLVPAPIEPRGFAGINFLPAAGFFTVCQLRALSAGGIFIETLFARGAAPLITDNYFIDVDNTNHALPAGPQVDIGGTPVLSQFTAGSVLLPVGGVELPSPDGFTAFAVPLGIFVPNQLFFTIRLTRPNQRLDVSIAWRELPSVEEVG